MSRPAPHKPVILTGPLATLGTNGIVSGIAKSVVPGPWTVTLLGIEGDAQGDLKHHGGVEKALHHYPRDHYANWQVQVGDLPLLQKPGAFGENLSTLGWTEANICIGDIVRFGSVLLQISQGRQPCFKLNRRFGRDDMAALVQRTGRTGWYYRVREAGIVAEGTELTLVDRPNPDWTLTRLIHLLYVDTCNHDKLAQAAAIPQLAEGWRALFRRRLENGASEDWRQRLTGKS